MEKLYLKGWEYNSYLIINKLSEIIKENKGHIVIDFPYINTYRKIEITNRNIENSKPMQVLFKNYINFILNDAIYYIQLQPNPFFEDYIIKEKVTSEENGKYIVKYNHYMDYLKKNWINDCEEVTMYSETMSPETIEKLANNLYKQILNAPFSEIVTTKKRVANYYDNRFHYENIKEERNKKYIIENIESEV